MNSNSHIFGFHSPVEKTCFKLLLPGKANIILCPVRELEHFRVLKKWRLALDEGRMLILSPFKERRADKQTTFQRNEFVARLSNEQYAPYLSPDSDSNKIL